MYASHAATSIPGPPGMLPRACNRRLWGCNGKQLLSRADEPRFPASRSGSGESAGPYEGRGDRSFG